MHARYETKRLLPCRKPALARAGATLGTILGTSLALLASPVHAQAQEMSTDVPLERFRLATDVEGVLDVDWGAVPGHLDWDFALWFDLADDPLVAYREEGGDRERIGSLVSRRLSASVLGSIALWDRVQLALEVPLVLSQSGDGVPMFMLDEPSSVGLGDIRLMPKVQILDAARAGVHLAFMPSITLPTGTGDNFGNEAGLAFVPELIASRAFGAFRVTSSLGYLARKDTRLIDLEVEDELFLRLGLGYRLSENGGPPLELDASLSAATAAAAPFDARNQDHVELRAGASYRIAGPVVGILAGGLGVREGFGTPDWRGVLGLRFSRERAPGDDRDRDGIRDADDACPLEAEDRDSFQDEDGCPDPDNDGDGVLDVDDACPLEAETANGFEDEDGCPDLLDRDGDGISDDNDACPDDAEDMDAFEDQDGCPDPDNDKDGVLDADDGCINEPGPAANRGCPDADRDGDGVVDRLDNCPDEAGTAEKQGCPTDQDVRLGDGRLELLDNVHFATNQDRILPRSLPLLRNAARVLNAHLEIERVRVEGHTDDRGDDAKNLDLSQRRAQAVVTFLVQQGVAADRLEAQGFGETKPVVPNTTAANRAKNRRVELHIVDNQ